MVNNDQSLLNCGSGCAFYSIHYAVLCTCVTKYSYFPKVKRLCCLLQKEEALVFVRSSLSYMYIKLDILFTVNPLKNMTMQYRDFFSVVNIEISPDKK